MTAWPLVRLGELLRKSDEWINLDPLTKYRQITVRLWGQGVVERSVVTGQEIGSETRLAVRAHQFLISRIDARNGASGLVPESLDGAVVSNDFPAFSADSNRLEPHFLGWYAKTVRFVQDCKAASEGTTNRVRLKEDAFYAITIPLPPLEEQRRIVQRIEAIDRKVEAASQLATEAARLTCTLCERELSTVVGLCAAKELALGEILIENSLNGLAARPSSEPPGSLILRISSATTRADFIVNESETRFLEISEGDRAKYTLRPGDLLACRFNGNLAFVGRFALYTGYSGVQHVYPDKLIRFRIDPDVATPEFVCFAMNSRNVRRIVESMCATTAGNIGIAATDLKTVRVPIPALSVQRELVQRIRCFQASVRSLRDVVRLREVKLESLMPSVLNQAFSGQL